MINIKKENAFEKLNVQLLRSDAVMPTRATQGSAGYDLYACTDGDIIIAHGDIVRVPTGVSIGIDSPFWVGLVYARSGLAVKQGLTLINCVGVVDSDYRGELFIPMINHGKDAVVVKNGDRVAQLVFAPIGLPELVQTDSLDETLRGDGAFGSTGIRG